MTRVVDMLRVRRALAALDALVERFPGLRDPSTRARLAKVLDGAREENDRGRHGEEEDH
jgi:hypothetical protein